MARHGGRRRRGHEEEHPDERWLLTYADMITLLMALFIVMYAMSSVNTSKFESLQKSLADAFSGKILPGGQALQSTGGSTNVEDLAMAPPEPSLQQAMAARESGAAAAKREDEDLRELQERIDAFTATHGLSKKVETRLDASGLTVLVLSDDLLFHSGSAELQPQAAPLVSALARLLRMEGRHRVKVEGHTDSVPVGGQFPSNWELSTARASAVVRAFARERVSPVRMEAAGRAHLDPVSGNATVAGRARNRRVEIIIPRQANAGPTPMVP